MFSVNELPTEEYPNVIADLLPQSFSHEKSRRGQYAANQGHSHD